MSKVILLGVVCAFATVPKFGAAQEPEKKAAEKATTKEKAELEALDAEVVEMVLVDLMSTDGSPLEIGKDDKKEIWLSETPHEVAPRLESLVGDHDVQGKPITKVVQQSMKDPAKDLIRRAESKDFLTPFAPKDKRVRVYTDKLKEEDRGRYSFERRQVFTFLAPGYSKDDHFAIVYFSFPWSKHGGDGTFLLEKRDKKWKVVLRQVSIYP